jgi:hypothetical protein
MAWHVESRTKSQKGSADRRESEMYVTESGQKVFVVDGHIHLWDARPENRRNRYGLTFIESFWGSHVGMTPDEQRWNFDRFCYYGIEGAAKDLFVDGYVDAAIMLPTNLRDFYVEGFNTIEQCSAFKNAYPEKVVLNGRFDPRDGQKGLDALEADFEKYRLNRALKNARAGGLSPAGTTVLHVYGGFRCFCRSPKASDPALRHSADRLIPSAAALAAGPSCKPPPSM